MRGRAPLRWTTRGGAGYASAVRHAAILSSVVIFALGCGESRTVDVRFSTPEHTVATLFATHGLSDESQAAIQSRIAQRGSFELSDAETWRLCFTDIDEPGGEGMAGYVLGMLAAARDQLRYELAGDTASVFPRAGLRVVMRRGEDGAYRIVLRESVPEQVRRGLLQVEENARRQRVPTGP